MPDKIKPININAVTAADTARKIATVTAKFTDTSYATSQSRLFLVYGAVQSKKCDFVSKPQGKVQYLNLVSFIPRQQVPYQLARLKDTRRFRTFFVLLSCFAFVVSSKVQRDHPGLGLSLPRLRPVFLPIHSPDGIRCSSTVTLQNSGGVSRREIIHQRGNNRERGTTTKDASIME